MIARSALALAVCAAALAAAPASAAPGLDQIQREFKAAIDKGVPATVSVIARDSVVGCSGVLVSRSGLVLSDFDAGVVLKDARTPPGWSDAVTVRVPDLATGAFVEYEGRIVKKLPQLDSTLIRIVKPPAAGFKYLVPASAEDLRVGAFTFAAGNAFGMATESLPAMTAGVVAAVSYLPRDEQRAGGRHQLIYTGAAVAPGVSGGPLLDAAGRLVGVVSGAEPVGDENPFQFLGRVMPIDRLRAAYAEVDEAKDAFDERPARGLKAEETAALESVIARAATDTYPSVASLVLERSAKLNSMTFGDKGPVELPRYLGPSSAVVVSDDGWLVTSLYNLTNVGSALSVSLGAALPPAARLAAGLESITKATAVFPDGTEAPAKLVATHEALGIALFKAEVTGRRVPDPAPDTASVAGRFVVPVANPWGTSRRPDPLVTFGIVSKRHDDDADAPWRGQLQTDAGATDGNCGAAVVDVEGRLVGVLTLWRPIVHGRNSGIGFVVPWGRIAEALPRMREGRSFRMPLLGLTWLPDPGGSMKVASVVADGPVAKAGVVAGDVVMKLGDVVVRANEDVARALRRLYAGDHVPITVVRGGQPVVLDVELGTRD